MRETALPVKWMPNEGKWTDLLVVEVLLEVFLASDALFLPLFVQNLKKKVQRLFSILRH